MDAQLHRGQMSAWLQKRKTGSAVVRLRQYNRRYFTIDFDSRVIFYSHKQDSKEVSPTMPFTDIYDVRLAETPVAVDQGDDNASNFSQASKASRFSQASKVFRRMRTKDVAQEYGFTVLMKSQRSFDLLCKSSEEATQWFSAFQFAISSCGSYIDSASCNEMIENGTGGQANALPSDQHRAVGIDPWLSRQGMSPAPQQFLDFGTQLECAPGPTQLEETVVNMASDFGFEAADDEDTDSESEHGLVTPNSGRRDSGASSGRSTSADFCEGDMDPTKARSASYKDQHEGLSLKERLDNLEFSDDEEDDDPFNLASARA